MIISHKHKFIFIHVHRTGGTSIANSLLSFLGESDEVYGYTRQFEKISETNRQKNIQENSNEQGKNLWKHSNPKYIKQKIGAKKWNEYFKFVVVRNPLDIHFSNYHYLRNEDLQKSCSEDVLLKVEGAKKLIFSEFMTTDSSWQYTLCDFCTSLPYKDSQKSPYKDGQGISNFNTDLDFIMKYERLKIDFAYFCGAIGLPRLSLNWLNKSRNLENRKLAFDEIHKNDKSLNFLAKRHAYDYNYFGYKTKFNEHEAKHNSYNW